MARMKTGYQDKQLCLAGAGARQSPCERTVANVRFWPDAEVYGGCLSVCNRCKADVEGLLPEQRSCPPAVMRPWSSDVRFAPVAHTEVPTAELRNRPPLSSFNPKELMADHRRRLGSPT